MSTTTAETLNRLDIISGWTFSCGGEAPPEGLAESVVPAVSKSTDGLFEITTITFGFSGTAPYHQQKFTAEFSFSISETANFYEIAVSSDDTATVRLGGNDFVSSQLNRNGIASSAWSNTAATLPEVSGTFETVGGPYSLSVTITLKRLVGAEWTVSEEWTETGPYEIKTATLSFSGNARSNTQGFSWNSPEINIDGGNWVEIEVDADDYAQVNVGEHSAEATLNNPETYGSDWVEEAPASFPITVSYRNAGGPYRLSVTVTVKRSLREVYFETELNTPDELNHVPAYSQEALTKKRQERLCFGCGEIARVKVRNKKTKEDFSEFPDRCWNDAALDKDNKFCAGTNCFPENGETKRECYLSADFSDGEIITIDFTVKYPTHETAQEISEADLVVFLKTENPRITDEEIEKLLIGKNEAYYGGLYYAVTVHPTDVSFRRLWFWENEHPEEKSGLFLDNGIDTVHKPHDPVMLNKYNIWTDSAWFGVTISDEKILNAEKDENWIVGKLTWSCPVRWSMAYENNTNTNTQNTTLPHDGKISGRVQHMELQRQLFPPLIKVRVSKEFNVSKIL